uniref:hypothetical protein n=1 Tax=Bartonella sp. AC66GZZY TaxID=3243458 RepID=UPI0035CEBAFE
IGDAAVKKGLADRIGSFEKLLSEISGNPVSEPSPHSINPNQQEKSVDDIQSLREAYPDLTASLEQDAFKQGVATERSRVQGILSHDEANARILLAQHLAFEIDMEVEAAVSVLSKVPLEMPTRDDVSGFSAAMAATPNPDHPRPKMTARKLSPSVWQLTNDKEKSI